MQVKNKFCVVEIHITYTRKGDKEVSTTTFELPFHPLIEIQAKNQTLIKQRALTFYSGMLESSLDKEPVKCERQRVLLLGSTFIWEKY